MTIVGKILVFIVLLLSLLTSAFAVFSYTARFNYDAALKEATKKASAAQSNAEQFYQELQKARAESDSRVAGVDAQTKSLREEIEGYKSQLAGAGKRVADAEARVAQSETTAKASQVDVSRRQTDVEKIRETLASEISHNTELVKKENEMRDRAVAAEIQVKSLKDIMARLENQLQETSKDLQRIKQNVGAGSRTVVGGANPPPENIEGLIKTADPGGLLKLTIGSDSGLAKGHTLEVFRLAAVASQSKYLGRVRILDVTPHEAIAQPIGRLSDKPQAGDHVASRILGGA
jgi:predicted  nucleic acid-binding Zn-ribbon protein